MKLRYVICAIMLFLGFIVKSQYRTGPVGPAPGMVRVVFNNEIRQTGGDIVGLANVHKVNIVYDYSRMMVAGFQNEEEYLEDKRKKYKEKKAIKFIDTWKSLPKQKLEPAFERKFNELAADFGMKGINDGPVTDVTLIVEILNVEPDKNGFQSTDPKDLPSVKAVCSFMYKNQDLLVRYVLTAYGSREPTVSDRLEECYSIVGKMLAKKIYKDLRKAAKEQERNAAREQQPVTEQTDKGEE